jgi:hypothetical protein
VKITIPKKIFYPLMGLLIFCAFGAPSCGSNKGDSNTQKTTKGVQNERSGFPPAYVPKNHTEFNNFNDAQELYDDPSSILWCTTTWGNPSAPMVTIPVAGKLTSSSVSYLPQDYVDTNDSFWALRPNFSSDGMYHGSPPPYRYGFTPGHQYVDFFNMPTLCTTAMTEFQRKQTKVSLTIDAAAQQATTQAEAALKAGTDPKTGKISPTASAKAQAILTEANLGG